MSHPLRVAVIMGGSSNERQVSLNSGRSVLAHLDPRRYQPVVFDPPQDLARLVDEAPNLDVALVMLHGRGGEDGSMQGLLDILGVPYQCAGVLGCALAMHKPLAKDRFRLYGLPVAPDVTLARGEPDPVCRVLETLSLPVVVKPALEGSSFGITIVRALTELPAALDHAFSLDREVLVEAFLAGREVTCAVLGNQELTPLPLVEITPQEKYQFFDYEAKYTPGASRETCPAPLDATDTRLIQDIACRAHRALGLKGYSRSDFILTPQGGPYILETNTIPGMTGTSLLPQSAQAAGMSFSQLLDRLIELALV
ncbi:MAG: D-alanine--D-alanine ligase [Pseudomonadota bacterium]